MSGYRQRPERAAPRGSEPPPATPEPPPPDTGKPIDHYEKCLRGAGFGLIAGVDEAGRGALAGPMVAAAVILPASFQTDGLADSKVLTAAERERWFDLIVAQAISWTACRAFPRRIDHRGLHVSNLALLRQALRALDVRPDFVLADGFSLPGVRLPHLSIKKGDAVTASVAAASIVAKVTRDRIMDRYHRRYPRYGFDRHKGYGTASHRAAIAAFGPSPIHRMSFKGMTMYRDDRAGYETRYANDPLLRAYGVEVDPAGDLGSGRGPFSGEFDGQREIR